MPRIIPYFWLQSNTLVSYNQGQIKSCADLCMKGALYLCGGASVLAGFWKLCHCSTKPFYLLWDYFFYLFSLLFRPISYYSYSIWLGISIFQNKKPISATCIVRRFQIFGVLSTRFHGSWKLFFFYWPGSFGDNFLCALSERRDQGSERRVKDYQQFLRTRQKGVQVFPPFLRVEMMHKHAVSCKLFRSSKVFLKHNKSRLVLLNSGMYQIDIPWAGSSSKCAVEILPKIMI